MILQSPGIDYNSLLNKCSANYSNVNSARAALSRALKDFSIYGLVRRQSHNFFATDKAVIMVNSEMKNKLVLKLNQAVNSKKPISEINLIVQRLSTLVERAKHDPGLLKAAKGSVDFSISDLMRLGGEVDSQANHLSYIKGVLDSHIGTLCELDFNDVKKTDFSNAIVLSKTLLQKIGLNEFFVETPSEQVAQKIEAGLEQKFKKNSLTVPAKELDKIFGSIQFLEVQEKKLVAVFLPPVKINFKENEAYFLGPYSLINSL
ncbi:MAG: hypothetical protein AABW85_06085 [archaeon]